MPAPRLLALWTVAAALACGGSGGIGPRAPFDDAVAAVAGEPDATSFAVAQDGVVVREAYFHGGAADVPQDVRSVTKSVVALLVGAALQDGCLPSLDATLGDLLGPLAPSDPAKAAISVRDLLTMSSGLEWSELGGDGYNQWAAAPDQVAYVLGRPLVAVPGASFDYDSGAFHLLSVALTRVCAPTAAFARDRLLAPLGIGSRAWETDEQGFTNGAAGLQLTTRELLALGQLVLDRGLAGGVQLVPGAYVDAATRQQLSTGASAAAVTTGYGYGWWVGTTASGTPFALAEGYGGQFLLVVPSARAVAAVTARWQGIGGAAAGAQFDRLLGVLDTDVLPFL